MPVREWSASTRDSKALTHSIRDTHPNNGPTTRLFSAQTLVNAGLLTPIMGPTTRLFSAQTLVNAGILTPIMGPTTRLFSAQTLVIATLQRVVHGKG
jgi:hypothetical protein